MIFCKHYHRTIRRESEMPKPITLSYCVNYIRGLKDYLLCPEVPHSIIEIKSIRQEIIYWQNLERLLRTQIRYRSYHGQRFKEIIRISKANENEN